MASYGLLFVALIICAGELGFPTVVPGEIALLVTGSQVIHSIPALLLAIFVFGALDTIATSTLHLIARTGGNYLLLKFLPKVRKDRRPPEEVLDIWRGRLGGHDAVVIFVTRLIPVFRMYASLTSGLIQIRLRDFFLGAVPAAFLWAGVPLTLGFLLRGHARAITSHYGLVLNIFLGVCVLASLLFWFLWRSRRARWRDAGPGGFHSRAS